MKHIRDESSYIISVITPDKTMDDFLADETLKRAVIRSLDIIGEATKKYQLTSSLNGTLLNGKAWQA